MIRQTALFLLALILILFAKAEVGVLAGARAGFTLTHIRKFSPPPGFSKRIGLGSDIAGVLRIDFNKFIGIQTEIEFIQKGQAWKLKTDSAKYVGKLVANYVQFPLLAVGRIGNEKIKGLLFLGPYFAYWTGGYYQNSTTIDKQTKHEDNEKYLFTKNDMRFDVGLTTGLGADFKIGKGWIELAARHNLGLLSMTKKNSCLPKVYNCNFSLSVGYIYTIK
ncbi:MAG: hypothetical protein JWN78_15 [Bacteroidota bacterium]|nr:hypothetical protein [Bacteroidota bacterium]